MKAKHIQWNQLYDTKQAAELISKMTGKPMAIRTLQKHIKSGKLPYTIVNGGYVMRKKDLLAYKRVKRGPKPKGDL